MSFGLIRFRFPEPLSINQLVFHQSLNQPAWLLRSHNLHTAS